MALVYLGLGSNIGDRLKNIEQAISLLASKMTVEHASTVIETDPIGGPPQEKYLNAVLKVTTASSPHELLVTTQEIERLMGRQRTSIKNAPRIIDIDILLYGDQRIHDKDLTIPHPRMLMREFVMKPLEELDSTLAHALLKENV
jgi:2-amino-4-hydroxy-6-hydroxymethyldihydropteridine diphosphokinase